jgi:polyisoprenoid-binding protein YceI
MKPLMKKLSVAIAAFVVLSGFTYVATTWKSDAPHSQLGFTVTHLGIADVSGTFNDFEVDVTSSEPDFSDAQFSLTAKIASIDTRVEMRDNHLKSPDFFDAAKYPTLTFKSNKIKPAGKKKYKLTGDLTLHGITKTVTMDLVYKGTVENPMSKKQTAGFQVKGVIKRSDFGVGPNFPAPMISSLIVKHRYAKEEIHQVHRNRSYRHNSIFSIQSFQE